MATIKQLSIETHTYLHVCVCVWQVSNLTLSTCLQPTDYNEHYTNFHINKSSGLLF